MNNISIYNDVTHRNETFAQYCKNFCKVNEPIINFYVSTGHAGTFYTLFVERFPPPDAIGCLRRTSQLADPAELPSHLHLRSTAKYSGKCTEAVQSQ